MTTLKIFFALLVISPWSIIFSYLGDYVFGVNNKYKAVIPAKRDICKRRLIFAFSLVPSVAILETSIKKVMFWTQVLEVYNSYAPVYSIVIKNNLLLFSTTCLLFFTFEPDFSKKSVNRLGLLFAKSLLLLTYAPLGLITFDFAYRVFVAKKKALAFARFSEEATQSMFTLISKDEINTYIMAIKNQVNADNFFLAPYYLESFWTEYFWEHQKTVLGWTRELLLQKEEELTSLTFKFFGFVKKAPGFREIEIDCETLRKFRIRGEYFYEVILPKILEEYQRLGNLTTSEQFGEYLNHMYHFFIRDLPSMFCCLFFASLALGIYRLAIYLATSFCRWLIVRYKVYKAKKPWGNFKA